MSYILNSMFWSWNNFRYKDKVLLDGECLCKISFDIALKNLNISL